MEWAARAIGLFYLIGGLALLRQCWVNWRLEQILALLGPAEPDPTEAFADAWHGVAGIQVTAAGLALTALHPWAVPAFVACWASQALYLIWARRWYPPVCPLTARGRRQTIHAFALFSLVCVGVIGLGQAGVLA